MPCCLWGRHSLKEDYILFDLATLSKTGSQNMSNNNPDYIPVKSKGRGMLTRSLTSWAWHDGNDTRRTFILGKMADEVL
jgi:hypothetical protein